MKKKISIDQASIFLLIIFAVVISTISCKKEKDWLDVKQNKSDFTPSSINDFRALLDNDQVMNAEYAGLGQLGSDNYYLTDANFQSTSDPIEKNAYLWSPDIFQGRSCGDWTFGYQIVSYANVVLKGVSTYGKNSADWDDVKGEALFFRAFSFYNLVQTFARPYSGDSSVTDPGIPLPLEFNANNILSRAAVSQTYTQILNDLTQADQLLFPLPSQNYQSRPSQASASALLARVYLNMGQYDSSLKYSSQSLTINSSLLDYNQIDSTSYNPFPPFAQNTELLFYATPINYDVLFTTYLSYVDSNLYKSYDPNDLRRAVFYQNDGAGNITFKGSYTGSYTSFSGLAVDEMYLTRAECYARMGNTESAMKDLNTLLSTRWRQGVFTTLTATDSDQALQIILQERRKELPFTTSIRWEDLRRLNKDPRFAVTLYRTINGASYTLPPNDKKYVYPIPPDELKYNPTIQQNPR